MTLRGSIGTKRGMRLYWMRKPRCTVCGVTHNKNLEEHYVCSKCKRKQKPQEKSNVTSNPNSP